MLFIIALCQELREIIFLRQCAGLKDTLSLGPNHQTNKTNQEN